MDTARKTMHGYGIKYCGHNYAQLMVMTLNNKLFFPCSSIVKKDFEIQVRAQTNVFFGGRWVKL